MRNRLLYRLFITMLTVNTIMPESAMCYCFLVVASQDWPNSDFLDAVPSLCIGAETSDTRSMTSGAAAGVEAWEEERVYEACRHRV
ncbi:hypothetical protein FEM48_Zijuj05G0133100 [Ziziphus jujuba var. spinosa]|uniref:Secreted protein n=1 Tax=Ziziphus jujuba var. spinosa TaxID=714518 RepID=A0A978VF22_ZIZJJ|nr:hypothetical protein FEM48_Zijuj05G0133100 [Ziziphus jujuba var. spinosa]